MPSRSLRALLVKQDRPSIREWAQRLDDARTEDETRAVIAAMLASDPHHGYPVVPVRRRTYRTSGPGAEVIPKPVADALRRMDTPSYVQGRLLDILAANDHARALSGFFEPGANLALSMFLGVPVDERSDDWEPVTRVMVRHLLDRADRDPTDAGLHSLIGELAAKNSRFRMLWATETGAPQQSTAGEWRHPVAGQLRLTREKTPIANTDGMMLVAYRAEPDSISETALQLLRALPGRSL